MIKKIFFIYLILFFCFPQESKSNEYYDSFSTPPIIDTNFNIKLQEEEKGVLIKWEKLEHDFMWHKVIRSQENNNPFYPEDGHIYYNEDINETEYLDKNPQQGKNYYRVCIITPKKERICSPVKSITIEEEFQKQESKNDKFCIQIIVDAYNEETGECKEFPTPCDIPKDWKAIKSCADLKKNNKLKLEYEIIKNINNEQLQPSMVKFSWDTKKEKLFLLGFDNKKLVEKNNFIDYINKYNNKDNFGGDILGYVIGLSEYYIEKVNKESINNKSLKIHMIPDENFYFTLCELKNSDLCEKASNTIYLSTISNIDEYFADLEDISDQEKQAIDYFYKNKIVNGFGNHYPSNKFHFKPYNKITRAEIAKIITLQLTLNNETTRTLRQKYDYESQFCDVIDSNWFNIFINYISKNNKINGFINQKEMISGNKECIGEKIFLPNNHVTRAEALKIIIENLNLKHQNNNRINYNDLHESHWFYKYGLLLKQNNIIEEENIKPDEPISRVDFCLYFYKLILLKNGQK